MTTLSKKVMSVALAVAVSASSAFSGSVTTQAATTKSESSQYAAATLTVKFKKPKDSTSTPTIYAYDRKVDSDGNEISGSSQKLAEDAEMTLDSSKEWYTYDLNTRHGFAYVIINCGDNRYPIKETDETKKDNAFRITSSVTIDATKSDVAPVATTFPTATSTPSAEKKEVTVHFKKPSNWSGTPYLYEYYRPEGQVAGSGTSQKELGEYPGVKMSQETSTSNWYSYTFKIHTTGNSYIKFVSSDEKNAYPVEDADKKDNSYIITATSWFDPDSSKETLLTSAPSSYDVKPGTSTPSTSPTGTPSQAPTATPIVPEILATAKPVKGPHVTTNYGEKARFGDASTEDYLYVELNLAGGATSATYTLDGGVAKTITENTVIKVGEGKIANSDITLQVTSTDGTTSNTQTFTYSKIPDYKNTVHQVLSQSMLKLFAAVKAAANTESTYKVTFNAPSTWKGTVYAYAYYDVKNSDGKVETQKPLGIWPGKKATKNADGTYSVDVSTSIESVNVIFADVTKEVPTTPSKDDEGNEYYDVGQCEQVPEQFKGGCKVTADSKISSTGVVTKISDTSPTPSATSTTPPTAEPTLQAYFGAEKSAPQLTTTKQQISAVASNAKGTLTYRFFVDDTELYNGSNNSVIWDPSTLAIGNHRLTVFITDTTADGKKKSIMLTKNYVLTDIHGSTPEPTEIPTTSPENSQTPGDATTVPDNSQAPSDATTVPEDSQAPSDATTVPDNSQTPSDATTVPDNTDTPVMTATAPAMTSTQAPQTATDGAVTIPGDQNAAGTVSTGSSVTGSVIFVKTGKTAGEDVTIRIATANKKSNAKYTYSYYVGSKAIAKNTTKTSATWTTSKKGTFAVKVIIYENGKQTAVASANYVVKARVITIKSLKTNKKSGQKKNTKITITAKATTKKGKVSYKFAVQKGSGTIKTIKGYSKKAKVTWKPTKKGTYKLYVYVKNGKGVTVKKTKTFKIK